MDTSYTFTCGDQGENHAGMQIIGKEAKEGVKDTDAHDIMERVLKTNRICEIVDLKTVLPDEFKDKVPSTLWLLYETSLLLRKRICYMRNSKHWIGITSIMIRGEKGC